jgi:hypothetical protein
MSIRSGLARLPGPADEAQQLHHMVMGLTAKPVRGVNSFSGIAK